MSEYVEVTPELLAGFLDEAREYIETLNRDLMQFEQEAHGQAACLDTPERRERMNEMFRAAHSLKGLSGTLGFDRVNQLTHKMETFFDSVRNAKRSLDARGYEVLYRVFDNLEELVGAIADGSEAGIPIDDSLGLLEELLSDARQPQPAAAAPSQDAPADQPAADSRDRPSVDAEVAVAANDVLDDPEMRQLFFDSTAEALDSLNNNLLLLEKQPGSTEIYFETFRLAHTIKGSVASAGLADVTAVAHEMETVLDELRNGRRQAVEQFVSGLLRSVDWIRSRLTSLQAGGSASPVTAPAQTAQDSGAVAGPEIDILSVDVAFLPDNVESDIQAFLIYNRVSEVADVISCDPDMNNLEAGQNIRHLHLHLRGAASPGEIEAFIRTFGVAEVKIGLIGNAYQAPASPTPAPVGPRPAAAPAAPAQPKISTASANVAPTPAAPARPRPASPAPATGAAVPSQGPKTGETLRVDVERLNQLMNLGGELVINRARFAQLQDRFRQVCETRDVQQAVQDLSRQIEHLGGLARSGEAGSVDFSRGLERCARRVGELQTLTDELQHGRTLMNQFAEAVYSLERISDGIQKRVMETRMVPIGPLFGRFKRVIRDLSKNCGKNIELVLRGENTELDKKMIDELGDPLTHLVRNSADHGVETPEQRRAAGKSDVGTVTLDAYHRGNCICVEIRDDGKGIDIEAIKRKVLERGLANATQLEQMSNREIMQFIFQPGFSTAKVVTDVSGRGMGMDIVRAKVEALNGTIEVDSTPGVGTRMTLRLPLTLAILSALQARIGSVVYAIPLDTVEEIVETTTQQVRHVQGRHVVTLRNRVIPVMTLEDFFGPLDGDLQPAELRGGKGKLVLIGQAGRTIGLLVDELLGEEDVVIKSIADNYRNVRGFTGASIMGDGRVSLILDVGSLLGKAGKLADQASAA